MTTIRETVATVADRIRGWLYFTAFAAMVSALWAAAWAQSLERDSERTWLAPALLPADLVQKDAAEVTRCDAKPAEDPESLWAWDVLAQPPPSTWPSPREDSFASVAAEP